MAATAAASRALPTAKPRPTGARRTLREMRKQWSAYLFLAPVLLSFSIFTFFSVGYAFWLSFHEWNILEPEKPFVGLDNYRRLTDDERFQESIVNTLYYTAGTVPLIVGLGLLIALLLNQPLRGRAIFRAVFYLPVITPLVIASIVWKWVYQGDYGLLNYYLIKLKLIEEPILWIADPSNHLAMPSVIVMSSWKSVGFAMVVYLAGLQAIPEEYYDAAKLDGAGPLRRLKDITIPLLASSTLFIVIIQVVQGFQVFTQVFVMTNGGPLRQTTTVIYHIYQAAFRDFRMGYAAAMAFALFAMMFVFALLQIRFLRREVEY